MRILHIVDRSFLAIVLLPVFREYIRLEGLAEQRVSGIFLISEDAFERGVIPCVLAELGLETVGLQTLADLGDGVSGNEFSVDAPDDLGFFFDDLIYIVAVIILLSFCPA